MARTTPPDAVAGPAAVDKAATPGAVSVTVPPRQLPLTSDGLRPPGAAATPRPATQTIEKVGSAPRPSKTPGPPTVPPPTVPPPTGPARAAATSIQAPDSPATLRSIRSKPGPTSASVPAAASDPAAAEMPRLFAPLPVRDGASVAARPAAHASPAGHVLSVAGWTMTLPAAPTRDESALPDGMIQRTYHLERAGVAYLVQMLEFAEPLDGAAGADLMAALVDGWAESLSATIESRQAGRVPTAGSIRFAATHAVGGRAVRTEGLATGRGQRFLQVTVTGPADAVEGAASCLATVQPAGTTGVATVAAVPRSTEVLPDTQKGVPGGNRAAATEGAGRTWSDALEQFATPDVRRDARAKAGGWTATPAGGSPWVLRLPTIAEVPTGDDGAADGARPWVVWGEADGHAYTASVVRLAEALPPEAAAVVAASLAEQVVEQAGGTSLRSVAIDDALGVGQRTAYRLPAAPPDEKAPPGGKVASDEVGPAGGDAASGDAGAVLVDHLTLIRDEWQIDLSITRPASQRQPALVEAILGSVAPAAGDRVARTPGGATRID